MNELICDRLLLEGFVGAAAVGRSCLGGCGFIGDSVAGVDARWYGEVISHVQARDRWC